MNLRARAALGRAVLRYRFLGIRTPIAIAWLVTGRCTACRSYCRWKSERDTNELGTTAALELIEEMAEAGVLMISFTGGEPLLRDDIGLLIHRVKSKGIVCKLNTNGDLVLLSCTTRCGEEEAPTGLRTRYGARIKKAFRFRSLHASRVTISIGWMRCLPTQRPWMFVYTSNPLPERKKAKTFPRHDS